MNQAAFIDRVLKPLLLTRLMKDRTRVCPTHVDMFVNLFTEEMKKRNMNPILVGVFGRPEDLLPVAEIVFDKMGDFERCGRLGCISCRVDDVMENVDPKDMFAALPQDYSDALKWLLKTTMAVSRRDGPNRETAASACTTLSLLLAKSSVADQMGKDLDALAHDNQALRNTIEMLTDSVDEEKK